MSDKETVRVDGVRAHRASSPCRGCGNPIIWGTTEEGKKIPLDKRASVYEAQDDTNEPVVRLTTIAFVSHWATCPDAYRPKGTRAWETNTARPPV